MGQMQFRSTLDEAAAGMRDELARRLIKAAELFAVEHSRRLGTPNPKPFLDSSKPGEYPRMRTGRGMRSLTVQPESPNQIARDLSVRVVIDDNAFYLGVLSEKMKRLGLLDTADAMKNAVAKIISTGS